MTVQTGDVKYAGTDANVFIQICGKDGKATCKIKLDDARNNFERGATEQFRVIQQILYCYSISNVDACQLKATEQGRIFFFAKLDINHNDNLNIFFCFFFSLVKIFFIILAPPTHTLNLLPTPLHVYDCVEYCNSWSY